MEEKKRLPTISIVIPTYNEEKNIDKCLKAIFSQDYPKELLEAFVVDGYSTDDTVQIAQKYPIKLIYNKARDAQVGKMMALKRVKGELFIYFDADIELRGRDWLRKMIYPLQSESDVIGSFTRAYSRKDDSALNRYLTYHPTQCDPLYEFFSPSIKETVILKKKNYQICQYKLGKIVPAGLCLYRREKILKTKIGQMEKFMELDNLAILVKMGYDKFAYVPSAGYFHPHIKGMRHLIRKRLRNIEKNYLPHLEEREYRWFDLNTKKGVIKIIFWIIYAHLLVPAFIKGVIKTIKHKDIACMYEPIVTVGVTDAVIFGFLGHPKGRGMVKKMLRNFLLGQND